MEILKLVIQISILLFASISSLAQSYFANGNAKAVGGSCYQLTSATDWQLGSVWYADKLDLSSDFDLEFELNFGSKDGGADGIVFVLQTVGNTATGLPGGGMGFEGFSPSFGIEFDDYHNASVGDITNDHIAILKNGSVDHNSANSISAPIPALPGGGNIEDGQNHLVRITWSAGAKQIKVWFDCSLRQTANIDIPNSIFGGESSVFWGFTSATGGANNTQTACLRDDILIPDTFSICRGETTLLNAKQSYDDTYTWTPNLYLNDNTIKNPECSSTIPFTYYVEYRDRCNNVFLDTVEIAIDEPFIMDEAEDTLLCNGTRYTFDLRNDYDSVRWGNGSVQAYTYWQAANFYKLRAWQGVCYADDSFTIRTNNSPQVIIRGDSLFCEGDSTELNVTYTPTDVTLTWPDLSSSDSKYFYTSTLDRLQGTNECGIIYADFEVKEIVIPPFTLGPDTVLCTGDTITLEASIEPNYTYSWSDGSVSPSIDVTTSSYNVWVEIKANDLCTRSDTINIDEVTPPFLQNMDDVLLCKNEEIVLTAVNLHGDVIWNNTSTGNNFVLKNYDGELRVKTENVCGSDSVSVEISLIDCYCNLIFPTGFTPNQDNLNETLNPYVDCPKLGSYQIKVYNRWGEEIFVSTDLDVSWDGTYKDLMCPNGVYFWVANWTGVENGLKANKVAKGVVTLLR